MSQSSATSSREAGVTAWGRRFPGFAAGLVMLSGLVAACGGGGRSTATPTPTVKLPTPLPGSLSTIPGAKGHDNPQDAVRAFFDDMLHADYSSAAGYVAPADRQTFQTAIASIKDKHYVLQIQDFQALSFSGSGTTGNVQVKAVGRSCIAAKCVPLTTSADSTAAIPMMADAGGQWYVSGFKPPS